AGRRNPQQKALVKEFGKQLGQEIELAATVGEKAQRHQWQERLASLQAGLMRKLPRAYIWYEDSPKAPVTRVFRRGDPSKPVGAVTPGVPRVLIDKQQGNPPPPRPLARSSGRRLWLARWLTRPENPLVARVIVNRLWQ